jgi:hypothetical protein
MVIHHKIPVQRVFFLTGTKESSILEELTCQAFVLQLLVVQVKTLWHMHKDMPIVGAKIPSIQSHNLMSTP